MPKIILRTLINAPQEVCFDLSRNIDLHRISTSHTQEKAIAGVTTGLIGLNEFVTWRARHFGIWFELTTRITQFEFPFSFTDEMKKGIFSYIKHRHVFEKKGEHTLMTDEFEYASPLGILGTIADKLIVEKHLRNLLVTRNEIIKEYAEKAVVKIPKKE